MGDLGILGGLGVMGHKVFEAPKVINFPKIPKSPIIPNPPKTPINSHPLPNFPLFPLKMARGCVKIGAASFSNLL